MTFSIIIPVYNVAPYLRESLDSVLAQSFTNWEALCVDDGSSDECGAILDEYAAKDSRFRVIHQQNRGVGAARNNALVEAEGEWLIFLDGDDVLAPFALQCLRYIAARHNNVDLIRFKYAEFDNRGTLAWPESAGIQALSIDISHEISMTDFHVFMWEIAYRKAMTQSVRFPKYRRGEDRVFVNTIQLTKANRMVSTESILYGYRIRQASAVHSAPSLQVLRDEMDHRLDIMEMIDASGKQVDYAGHYWLEGYFTRTLPMLTLNRPEDARAIVREWRMRLPRLLQCQGLSKWGRRRIALSSSRLFCPVGDLLIFTLPNLRSRIASVKPLARLYRRLLRYGEFARKEMP